MDPGAVQHAEDHDEGTELRHAGSSHRDPHTLPCAIDIILTQSPVTREPDDRNHEGPEVNGRVPRTMIWPPTGVLRKSPLGGTGLSEIFTVSKVLRALRDVMAPAAPPCGSPVAALVDG